MLRFWIFIVCLLWLVWSAAQMDVLWTIAAYVLAGAFWVAHERQKTPAVRIVVSMMNPLRAVALWPVYAGTSTMKRIKSLTSAERYAVNCGHPSTNQGGYFRTWGEALSFARQKAAERASTARESASPLDLDRVIIIDQGRLRRRHPDILEFFPGIESLTYAQYEVQDSGEVRRIV